MSTLWTERPLIASLRHCSDIEPKDITRNYKRHKEVLVVTLWVRLEGAPEVAMVVHRVCDCEKTSL